MIFKFKNNLLFLLFLLIAFVAKSQKVDSLFANLYTDSLKKGTYNYINIDGKMSNGNYVPLDSTELLFWSNEGKFYGNTLFIDKNFNKESVFIKVVLRKNPRLSKEFTMFIKRNPDNENLKTSDQLLKEIGPAGRKGRKTK